MKPVSELTPAEAVAELEQICDAKPAEDQVIARARWFKQYGDRIPELEARILAAETPAEPGQAAETAPTEPEKPMPKPKRTPSDLLTLKVETYNRVHGELAEDPGNKKLRDHLNMLRYDVREQARRAGVDTPELPEPPASPFGHRPRKPMAAEPHRPVKVPHEPAPEPALEPEHHPVPQVSISQIRASIWKLMASLEEMTPDQRALLVDELALLDAAAHAAHGLATGQLQVAC